SLNSDGSLYTNPNRVAAGGVIRDDNGRFVSAFTANLGSCSIMRAELTSIVHIYREANYAADYLANLGHTLDLGIHVFDAPDTTLLYWLNFDVVGACTSHLIPFFERNV
ncbi:hypothetical protein LINPERPRIM_LOCUS24351, partial [Linum perenne]